MLGVALGIGAAALGSLFSSNESKKAAKRKRLYLDQMERDAQNEYNNSLGDGTQTAAQQMAATNMRRLALDQLAQTDANNVVKNGTGVERAQTLEAINDAAAQQAGAAAVQQQQREDAARQQLHQTKQNIMAQRMNIEQAQAKQSAQAGAQIAQAGMQLAVSEIAGKLDDGKKSKPKTNTSTDKPSTPNTPPPSIQPAGAKMFNKPASVSPDISGAINKKQFGGVPYGSPASVAPDVAGEINKLKGKRLFLTDPE